MGNVTRTPLEYWRGALAYAILWKREKKGLDNYAPPSMANDRAAICDRCAFNIAPSKTVGLSDQVILRRVGERTTAFDQDLKHCDACSCPLRLIVHLHAEVLLATKDAGKFFKRVQKRERETRKLIHPECWMAKLLS